MAKSRRVLRRKNKSRRRRGGMNAPAAVPDAMLVQKVKELVNSHTEKSVQEALAQVLQDVKTAGTAPASEAGEAQAAA